MFSETQTCDCLQILHFCEAPEKRAGEAQALQKCGGNPTFSIMVAGICSDFRLHDMLPMTVSLISSGAYDLLVSENP
jgi:hypothetical protein